MEYVANSSTFRSTSGISWPCLTANHVGSERTCSYSARVSEIGSMHDAVPHSQMKSVRSATRLNPSATLSMRSFARRKLASFCPILFARSSTGPIMPRGGSLLGVGRGDELP
jgi:hypothetical protein